MGLCDDALTKIPRAEMEERVKDVLNVGCGRKLMSEAVNLDISADVGADVVHDLSQLPWPLPPDSFGAVHAFDVIEHLENVVGVMEEIHRVCRPAARVHITVPHFSSANAYTDPTHRHHFSYFSFDYFEAGHELAFYSKARFRRRSAQIVFYPSVMNKVVHRLANRFPLKYEQRWAWIFPAWFLSLELEAVK